MLLPVLALLLLLVFGDALLLLLLFLLPEGLQGGAGGQSGSSPLPQPEPPLLLLLPWLLLLLGDSLPYPFLLDHVPCSCCRSSMVLQQLPLPQVAPGVLQGGAGGRCGSSALPQPEPP